jgi:hypothetical protein
MNNSAGPAKGSWSDQEVEKLRVLVEKADEDPTQAKISKENKWNNRDAEAGYVFHMANFPRSCQPPGSERAFWWVKLKY